MAATSKMAAGWLAWLGLAHLAYQCIWLFVKIHYRPYPGGWPAAVGGVKAAKSCIVFNAAISNVSIEMAASAAQLCQPLKAES